MYVSFCIILVPMILVKTNQGRIESFLFVLLKIGNPRCAWGVDLFDRCAAAPWYYVYDSVVNMY